MELESILEYSHQLRTQASRSQSVIVDSHSGSSVAIMPVFQFRDAEQPIHATPSVGLGHSISHTIIFRHWRMTHTVHRPLIS